MDTSLYTHAYHSFLGFFTALSKLPNDSGICFPNVD